MVMGCVFGLQEVYYKGLSSGDLGSLVGVFFLQAWTESFPFHSCGAYNGSRVSKLHSRAALSVWRFERRMEFFLLFIHARLYLNRRGFEWCLLGAMVLGIVQYTVQMMCV